MNGFAARPLAALVASLFFLSVMAARAEDATEPAKAGPAAGGSGASAPAAGNDGGQPPQAAPAAKNAAGGAGAAATAAEPRHGARSKASDGSLVVYDKVVGAYRATDHPATYWVDGRFWRFENEAWTSAAALAGPWAAVAAKDVPKAPRALHSASKSSTTIVLPSGREAIFEPRLKVHKVVGRKGVFLFDGRYYRYDAGVWFESKSDDGPWAPTSAKPIPAPLKRALPAPVHGDKVEMPSGETLVYDADSRLYDVEGRPDAVYFDGAFYERDDERWMRSASGVAGMEPVEVNAVPVPVRAKYHKPGGKKAASATKPAAGEQGKAAAKKNAATGKQAARKSNAAGEGAKAPAGDAADAPAGE